MSRFNLVSRAAVAASAFAASVSAFADTASQTAVTTAMTTASADVAVYGAALIGLSVVGVGFMVGMKYVKKIRGAA